MNQAVGEHWSSGAQPWHHSSRLKAHFFSILSLPSYFAPLIRKYICLSLTTKVREDADNCMTPLVHPMSLVVVCSL